MSQLCSLSGKLCFACSNSTFVLQDSSLDDMSTGTSIQCETYGCPNCGLIVEYRRKIHTSNTPKVEPMSSMEVA